MVKKTFWKFFLWKKSPCFDEESYEIAKDFWRIWVGLLLEQSRVLFSEKNCENCPTLETVQHDLNPSAQSWCNYQGHWQMVVCVGPDNTKSMTPLHSSESRMVASERVTRRQASDLGSRLLTTHLVPDGEDK
jgi:hypothetical protein